LPEEDVHPFIFLLGLSQAANDNYRNLRIDLADERYEFRTSRLRHDVVGNDHADLLRLRQGAKKGERTVRAGSDFDFESGLA